MEQQLSSITDFLQQGDFHYRIFDMGRRVTRISNQKFEKIETQQEVYPYPFLQAAWLGIVFWDKHKNDEPVIWFLKFQIDEMGLLMQSARDAFLQQLLDHLGQGIKAQHTGNNIPDSMKESPFAFKPKQDRLAIFHAKTTVELGQPASQFYQHTQNYIKGDVGFDQWAFLGLQGIADIIARLDKDENEANLGKAIKHLPDVPLENFCNLLEHAVPQHKLTQALIARLDEELRKESANIALLSALLRSITNSQLDNLRQNTIEKILQSPHATQIELLAAISGRAWNDLSYKENFSLFLEALATHPDEAFTAVLIDLMMLPNMRNPIMEIMRNPESSNAIREKVGKFLGGVLKASQENT